jgi:hypothetical protein
MKMIEIYKERMPIIWNDSKTFLVVFDENGNQVADYDFSNGLQILQDDQNIVIFVNSEDILPGKWKFFGTKSVQKNGKIFEESVFSFGEKEGDKKNNIEEDVWQKKRVWGNYVSFAEREKRINICRKCDFFNQENGICLANDVLVLEFSKHKYYYCPEGKWGSKEDFDKYYSEISPDDIIMPAGTVTAEDQEDFEKELERYLKEKNDN